MMKLPLFVACVLAAVLAAAPVFAQPEPKEAKTPDAVLLANNPRMQVEGFFRILVEGRVDAAYDQLLQGTAIAEMPKDVLTLKAKTKEAIRAFGSINGCDFVSEQKIGANANGAGSHLLRLTYLSIGNKFPIRWRFYFYKPADAWKLIDIRIDDRLLDMFEEPAPTAAGAVQ